MLDFIRTHKRISQFLLLIFIVPSFVFVGVSGYSSYGDKENVVAKVAGYSITQEEWDGAQRRQVDRMRKVMGARFDAKIFESPEFKDEVLNNLIAQRALAAEVGRQHMSVSDQVLQQSILSIPELIKPDGTFDKERYKSLLASQGLTEAGYDAALRHDLTMQQIRSGIQSSAFIPKTVATRISDLAAQVRDVQPMLIKSSDYLSKVVVTDDMLKDFYNKNWARFEMPEQMKAEYVVLTTAAVAASISVSDTDVKSYYEQNTQRYATKEKRRASHILIKVAKDASDADKVAAKEKAESILKQVRKKPSDFSRLAKKHSQDSGSAVKGGDLNYFGRGMMVKPFDNEVFKLKKGEISNLVVTDFGYHLIMLTGIKPSVVKPLKEVKAEIATAIKRQLVSKKFAAAAEIFTNMVYEQSDSLKPVAEELKLEIKTVSGLQREVNSNAAGAPYNKDKFLRALFSDEVTKNELNSEAIEISPNVLIAGRVLEYTPKKVRPFKEVKPVIEKVVKFDKATTLATRAGEAKLAKLQQGGKATGFDQAKSVSRAQRQGIAPDLLLALMKADVSKLPAYVGLSFPQRGYGIYRIIKVTTPKQDEAHRQAEAREISNILSQQEMMAYLEALKLRAKVEVIKSAKASANKADD